jgi:mannose-6-phosphate isomerase
VNEEYGLSIQLHPTKTKAEELHRRAPHHYPDSNHKPEVGVALTPVSLLYGVKNRKALSTLFSALPGLIGFVRYDAFDRGEGIDADLSAAKRLFAECFALDDTQIRACNHYLAEALREAEELPEEARLFTRLSTAYGTGDPGLIAMLFMNQVHLAPGQAIFISANIPHAYLEGDLIECMACSDNVVRAGLTSKYKDVETLLEVIDCSPSLKGAFSPVPGDAGFRVIETLAEEFRLQILPENTPQAIIPVSVLPAVLFCVGRGTKITSLSTGRSVELTDGGAALLPPHSGAYEVVTTEALLVHASPALT